MSFTESLRSNISVLDIKQRFDLSHRQAQIVALYLQHEDKSPKHRIFCLRNVLGLTTVAPIEEWFLEACEMFKVDETLPVHLNDDDLPEFYTDEKYCTSQPIAAANLTSLMENHSKDEPPTLLASNLVGQQAATSTISSPPMASGYSFTGDPSTLASFNAPKMPILTPQCSVIDTFQSSISECGRLMKDSVYLGLPNNGGA